MSTVTYRCTHPDHGDNPRIWDSKQTDKDLSKVRCSKKGGADGCGNTGHVELFSQKSKPTFTGSDFQRRYAEMSESKHKEDKKIRKEIKQSKKSEKTSLGFLISDSMIYAFHRQIFTILEDYVKLDIHVTPEIEEELKDKAKAVLNAYVVEETPLTSYLLIWGSILAPAIVRKIVGFLRGGKKKEKIIEGDKNSEETKDS